MIKINENIKKIRVNKGYIQHYMAEKLGLSLSAYSNIESGKADVNLTRLAEIAKIFDMTLIELITYNNEAALTGSNFAFDSDGAMKELYEHIIEQNKEYIDSLKLSIDDLRDKVELYKELYESSKTAEMRKTPAVAKRKRK